MTKSRTRYVNLGPAVPLVPVGHFSKLSRETIELAWQIVGPSVQMNLSAVRSPALWQVFAACYAEGLEHGMSAMREKLDR